MYTAGVIAIIMLIVGIIYSILFDSHLFSSLPCVCQYGDLTVETNWKVFRQVQHRIKIRRQEWISTKTIGRRDLIYRRVQLVKVNGLVWLYWRQ